MNEDTFGGTLTNPLSLNLYSYTANNPLRYSDPSGHMPISNNLLNMFLSKYVKEGDTQRMVNAVIGTNSNSDNGRYMAFHQITQIIAAREIHSQTGQNTQLEYHLEKEIKWWPNKHYWVDIVTGDNQMWEVKARRAAALPISFDGYYEDAEAQLDNYASLNDKLKRGQQFEDILGIEIVGNLRMNIDFYDQGKILYDFYLDMGDGKSITMTTSQAEDYVQAVYDYPINPFDFIKLPKVKK